MIGAVSIAGLLASSETRRAPSGESGIMAGSHVSHVGMSKLVSVVIVNYNTRDFTLACLNSVHGETLEIIVVDNASTDGSAEAIASRFPEARVIASGENLGFAAANNLAAARCARGKYLLLLNPDTIVLSSAIDRLVEFAEQRPAGGIYGGRTLFADGSLNPTSCWRKPSLWGLLCRAVGASAICKGSRIFNFDAYGGWQRDSERAVDIVSGCFFLIHRELWERLGGFDESFHMYGEDWDLCIRARKLGAQPLFCPDTEIIHYGGASEAVRADKIVRLFRSQRILFRRHWGSIRSRLFILILHLWVLRACLTSALLRLTRSKVQADATGVWREVWRRRKEWAS